MQDGWTALDLASYYDHTDVVKVLLASGAHQRMKYFVSAQPYSNTHSGLGEADRVWSWYPLLGVCTLCLEIKCLLS